MDAVRLHRQGFPKFLSHQEFARRFHLLAPNVSVEDNHEKIAVEEMVQILDLDPATYRIGLNKVSNYIVFLYTPQTCIVSLIFCYTLLVSSRLTEIHIALGLYSLDSVKKRFLKVES